jgi:peptidoglycan/LPS O-acetylase OafA/YrhL
MRYRPEIDGLRSVAVLPVVLFHAGVPGFPGGFVGVDIFFVISGYLITGMIAEEVRQGTFTITGFYERRIRRIFPALIVMLAVCAVLAGWLLFPADLVAFARSVVATALFGSNLLFWQESGYFDVAAADKPLLHTWSLAVEEQFYIFFPIFLWMLWRWHARYWVAWVAAATVASFALSAWAIRDHADAAFYLLPTRAWELFLGALLALDALPAIRNRALREGAAALGLALIAWGVFQLTDRSPFPGPNALFPCVGAALLIWTGAETAVGRVLATAPLRGIGLISYSLYLWHWPVIVFLHQAGVYVFTPAIMVGVIAVSVALAWASWKFVETPFRQRRRFGRPQIFALGLGGMTAVCLVGTAGAVSGGWPDRFPPDAIRVAAYAGLKDPREMPCTRSKAKFDAGKLCSFGAAVDSSTALWGDSHGGAMAAAIGDVAAAHNQSVQFVGHSGCPPVVGVARIDDPTCAAFNEAALGYFKQTPSIRTVILLSRYAINLYGGTYDFGPAEEARQREPLITAVSDTTPLNPAEAERLFATQIRETVKQLVDAGKSVVLVYPIPETGYDIPKVAARMIIDGEDPASFVRPAAYFQKRQGFIIETLDSLGPAEKIIRIRPREILCDESNCQTFKEGVPLYRDDDHPSAAGAAMIAALFDPVFDPVVTGKVSP